MAKIIFIQFLFLGCLTCSGAVADPTPALLSNADESKLAKLESRVSFIEKKLSLLAAATEQELAGVSAVMGSPALLRQQADHALKVEKSVERAYRYLAILRAMHPESSESKSSYPLAVGLFNQLYFRNRFSPTGTLWTTVEPVFILQWTADLFVPDSSTFPIREVEALLIGVPVEMVRKYEAFSISNPAMAKWSISFTDDNGIVESITPRLK